MAGRSRREKRQLPIRYRDGVSQETLAKALLSPERKKKREKGKENGAIKAKIKKWNHQGHLEANESLLDVVHESQGQDTIFDDDASTSTEVRENTKSSESGSPSIESQEVPSAALTESTPMGGADKSRKPKVFPTDRHNFSHPQSSIPSGSASTSSSLETVFSPLSEIGDNVSHSSKNADKEKHRSELSRHGPDEIEYVSRAEFKAYQQEVTEALKLKKKKDPSLYRVSNQHDETWLLDKENVLIACKAPTLAAVVKSLAIAYIRPPGVAGAVFRRRSGDDETLSETTIDDFIRVVKLILKKTDGRSGRPILNIVKSGENIKILNRNKKEKITELKKQTIPERIQSFKKKLTLSQVKEWASSGLCEYRRKNPQ